MAASSAETTTRLESLLAPVIVDHYPCQATERPATVSIALRPTPLHTTTRQPPWSNCTSQSTTPHTHTPAHHDDNHYVQLYTAITLEEYQLLSLQRPTPRSQLDYTLPVQCIPGDLRMPHYDSTSLSTALAEACNVHHHLTT